MTYFYFILKIVSGVWRMSMEEAESKGGEEVRKNINMVRHKTHNYILLRSTGNKSRAES
jgi:nickel-dependent lactate racemase